MMERQRPGGSGLVVTGGAVAVGLCLLALASAPARASEIAIALEPAPERSPQTAGGGEAPANVKPDPAPQTAERTSRSPGESTQSGTSPRSGTSPHPQTGASVPAREPNRPAARDESPPESAPSAGLVTTIAPATTHTAAARRSQGRHRGTRAGPARTTVRGRHHARPPVTGATAFAAAVSHRQGLLLLLASLASGLLVVAGVTLLRLLRRLDGSPSMGFGA